MIITSNIFGGAYTSVNEENVKTLVDFYSKCLISKFYKISVTISAKTLKKCHSQIVDMFGEDVDRYLTIKPNREFKFGYIRVAGTNAMIGAKKPYQFIELEVFHRYVEYNLEPLKAEIMMDNPSFLITNLATWEQISNIDYDHVGKYENGSAYYHTYYKIPVAICEIVKPNMVNIVA